MGVRLVKYSRTNSSSSNSGGQIYNDHDELTNRDLKNQHPIYAITGLQEVLNVLEDSITETNKLIIATNERIDAILLDIEKIQKEIQDIYDIINNLNIMHYKAVVKGYRCVRPQLPFYRKLANPYLRYLHNFILLKL